MLLLTWAIPLIIVIFLWTLNDFLRGRLKERVSGVLAILIFALCIVAFFVSGWKIGLAALIGSFVLGKLFRYPAFLLARWLVQYPDLGVDDHLIERHMQMMSDFSSTGYFERHEKEKQEEAPHMARTIDQALRRSDIQEVLRKHISSREDVEAFYQRLEISSLPANLREVAVCNANLLDYFLKNSVRAEVAGQHTRNIQDQNIAITFALWVKHDPSGRKPQ